MPNAEQMLFKVLTDPVNGLKVAAEDGVTLLVCKLLSPAVGQATTNVNDLIDPTSTLYIKLHPYQPEKDPSIHVPMIVIGGGATAVPVAHQFAGDAVMRVVQTVEIRVLTRPQDTQGQDPIVDGDRLRRRIIDNLKLLIRTNHSNPGGTGDFLDMLWKGSGRDTDEPEAVPLYRTPCFVAVEWFE